MKNIFEENKVDWTTVDEYQKEATLSGFCMAMAECDKLLNYILTAQGYRGQTIYEKIRSSRDRYSDLEGLAQALETKENIFMEYDKSVSKQDVEMAIKQYKQAILDLTEKEIPDIGVWGRFRAWVDYHFLFKPGTFRRTVFWVLGIVLVILILDNTEIGKSIVSFFAKLLYSSFSFLTILGLVIVLGVLAVIGLTIYIERSKRKKP